MDLFYTQIALIGREVPAYLNEVLVFSGSIVCVDSMILVLHCQLVKAIYITAIGVRTMVKTRSKMDSLQDTVRMEFALQVS